MKQPQHNHEVPDNDTSTVADSVTSSSVLRVSKGATGNDINVEGTEEEITNKFSKTLGTADIECGKFLIRQIHDAHPERNNHTAAEVVNQVTPLLHAIETRDELEGMLAAQMVSIHNLTMEIMKRVSIPDQTVEGVNNNINRITKLSRTFVAQLEALDRHRNKGKQKMIVEHVHINKGGQAIIGNVDRGEDSERK